MMISSKIKVRKGGVDTIVAFIIILIPITYIIAFMIATIYHFSVQQYMNQVIKETLIMASSYGEMTSDMQNYMIDKLNRVVECNTPTYRIDKLNDDGTISVQNGGVNFNSLKENLHKGDLLGILITSKDKSILCTVSNFSLFSGGAESDFHYRAYKEEIIRNEAP